MRDPHELYELNGDLPDLGQPALIQAMSGFVDAGRAARLAREHLLAAAEPQVLARFDLDQLLDYRSRRPTMVFVEDHWESYEEQVLALYLLPDGAGTPYLLLSGPEPDLQWDRFIAAVTWLVERFQVRLTVGMTAIPMAVPHTRPTGVTAHATRPELVADYQPWLQRVQVPASAGNLLELRLGQQGRDAMGFAAHVPHYLGSSDYPAAAEALLTSVSRATGLSLPTEPLRKAAEELRATVDTQVAGAEEVAAHVRGLEEQYDVLMQSRQGSSLLGDLSSLPSADELGAELERFLADQSRPGDPPT
ncbi:MAG: PAC2 family protein [Micromonosporaceae bacterium]|nr:PAC2 family protein [Micromonosporaceae bacterium]